MFIFLLGRLFVPIFFIIVIFNHLGMAIGMEIEKNRRISNEIEYVKKKCDNE